MILGTLGFILSQLVKELFELAKKRLEQDSIFNAASSFN